MTYEKFLPIGTVVILKGGSKRCMITGFCVTGDKDETMYDYCGVLYPEGVLSSNQTLMFNHNQIDKLYHLGFIDDEEKQFKLKLNEIINNTKSDISNNNQQINNANLNQSNNISQKNIIDL